MCDNRSRTVLMVFELFQELETYRQYAVNKQNYAQEKQEFLSMQKANNEELEREMYDIKSKLTDRKQELKNLTDTVKAMENEVNVFLSFDGVSM